MGKKGFVEFEVGGEAYEARRDNTSLYRHLGKMALYDHVFIELNEEYGIYVWNTSEHFELLAKLAIKNKCRLYLNIPQPTEQDVSSYIRHHTDDTDEIPDWLPEI